LFSLIVAAFLMLAFVSIAGAQVVEPPDMSDSPLGQNVSGFLSVSFGMIYVPTFSASSTPSGDNFDYQTRSEKVSIPGFSAHISLIPAWGQNAVQVEGGYELLGVDWNQTVNDTAGQYTGDSTLALGFMSLSTNYIRYFLTGDDRIYLLAGGGYVWETANLSTETGDEGTTDSSGFANWRINSGIGYLHQMRTGAVGVEFRADLPLNDTVIDLSDPYGSYELTLEHPVMLRLCLTLAVGRLKEPASR